MATWFLCNRCKQIHGRHHGLINRYEISISQMAIGLFLLTLTFLPSITNNTFTGRYNTSNTTGVYNTSRIVDTRRVTRIVDTRRVTRIVDSRRVTRIVDRCLQYE
jgi:hypothetical protein